MSMGLDNLSGVALLKHSPTMGPLAYVLATHIGRILNLKENLMVERLIVTKNTVHHTRSFWNSYGFGLQECLGTVTYPEVSNSCSFYSAWPLILCCALMFDWVVVCLTLSLS